MFELCLIFSGIAFFVNGFIPLIEETNKKEISMLNFIVGILTFIIAIFGITTNTDLEYYLLYGSIMILSITHLYIAFTQFFNVQTTSFGWLCLLFFIITIALGIYYIINDNSMFGFKWIVWSLLFIAYYVKDSLKVLKTSCNIVIMLEGLLCLTTIGILALIGVIIL